MGKRSLWPRVARWGGLALLSTAAGLFVGGLREIGAPLAVIGAGLFADGILLWMAGRHPTSPAGGE